MKLVPFTMERWQSTYEHQVAYNLSESGVHPMTAGELLSLADTELDMAEVLLGYGQSNGTRELRGLVAELHPGATSDSVVITTGGAEANFAVAWRRLEEGSPLAALVPNYMQIPGIQESFGAKVLPVPLLEEAGWAPDMDALRAALAAGARTILITQPNNPTGASLSPEVMDEIVAAADSVGAWILADEVYRGAEVSGVESPTFWGRYDRLFVTGSLSKAYGLPGLRVGWVVGPDAAMEDLWARSDYTTIAPASLSDALATLALSPGTRERVLERTRGILRTNLPIMESWMDAQPGRFSYRAPDAGAICYVRYHADVNSTDLAEYLRSELSTLVVPGDQFGMDRYLRLGFGPASGELTEALDRVSRAFDALSPAR